MLSSDWNITNDYVSLTDETYHFNFSEDAQTIVNFIVFILSFVLMAYNEVYRTTCSLFVVAHNDAAGYSPIYSTRTR